MSHATCDTVDPVSKSDQKIILGGETGKYTWEKFRFFIIIWYIVSVWTSGFWVLSYDCLSVEGMLHAFSLFYNHIAALSLCEQYILCPIRHASADSC